MNQKQYKKKISLVILFTLTVIHFAPVFDMIVYAEEPSSTSQSTTSDQLPVSTGTEIILPAIGNNMVSDNSSTAPTTTVVLPLTTGSTTVSSLSNDTTTASMATSSTSVPLFNLGNNTATDTSTTSSSTEVAPVSTSTSSTTDIIAPAGSSSSSTTSLILPSNFTSTGTTTMGTTTTLTNSTTSQDQILATSSSATTTEGTTGSTTDVLSNASTTDNSATSSENNDTATGTLPTGTTTIKTGDAVAMANILNIVNTNLINSTGSITMANILDGNGGSIDFRNSTSTPNETTCTLLTCNGVNGVTAKIESNASIDNAILIDATSGGNLIDTAGTATINTGNVFAGLNLVNIANTNLIDSNYFLLSLNSFSTFNGDIVLPSLANFFSNQGPSLGLNEISLLQAGSISNNLDVNAQTGNNNNSATNGTTQTGNTTSSTNVYNNINSLLVGGNSIALLLKVSGKWLGELFGAPTGSSFTDSGNLKIFNFDSSTPGLQNPYGTSTLVSSSTASISNDVKMLADSGSNEIKNTENSQIKTGKALASANLINIANANIVGRNWILAILNIFGDFNGNISFGRPDLWLGEQVTADPSSINNGSQLTYKLTVINRGDSRASKVQISSAYDRNHLDINDSDLPYTQATTTGDLIFEVGNLAPNEAKEIIFHATIKGTDPGTGITNTSTATEHETDNNNVDNTDTATITTTSISIGGGGFTLPPAPQATATETLPATTAISITPLTFAVTRTTASSTIVGVGTIGKEELVVHNLTGDTIPPITFYDILHDQNGNEIQTENWDLGNILPYEEITLSYDVSFKPEALAGVYTLSSELYYASNQKLSFNSNGYITYILNNEAATVSTSTSTAPIIHPKITSPVKRRVNNKGSVLGSFTESVPPQMTNVEATSQDTPKAKGIGYQNVYLLFFLTMSSLHAYRRQPIKIK